MQHIVEIARCLSTNACIIIFDEPTASLTRSESEELYRIIDQLKADGVSIIFISHRFEDMYRVASRVTVFRDSQYIGTYDVNGITNADLIKAMEADAGVALAALKVDGGAAANNFLMEFQADILNAHVIRPTCLETTALGAAYLAGLAVGYYADTDEIKSNWACGREFLPEMSAEKSAALYAGWKKAVKRAMHWESEKE